MFTGYCGPVEFHHFTSGGIRVGHLWGVALGQWHHRGRVLDFTSHARMREHFGPALSEGSKPFHDAFGSDALLLEMQDELLRQHGLPVPSRPDNRRWAA